jgi:cell division septation protein DedD
MRTIEEREELTQSDTEITLGMKSILGIFFGLALICGVFFGFGYSLGRGNPARTSATTASPSIASAPDDASSAPVKTVVDESEPDDNAALAPKPSGAIPEAAPATVASVAPVTPQPTLVSESKAPAAPSSNIAAAAVPAATPDQPAAIIVQIAAVSRREDADVLVTALGKLGYHAFARPASSDNLLHVQVGPFATRAEAKTMQTRLLNDGYNAILK